MKWKKLGRIYVPTGDMWWARTNAMIPTPLILDEERVRVYISSCDDDGIGRVGYVDLDIEDLTKVIAVADEPLFEIGQDGTFDENGCLVCSVVSLPDGQKYLYYAGFELGMKIRYRLLTGLAIQKSGSENFEKAKQVPVLERTDEELFFRTGAYVVFEEGRFKMWYVAGSGWDNVKGMIKPVYEIRYTESDDGINWPDKGQTCIPVELENEHGFGRPYVIKNGDLYQMYYSVRRRDVGSYRLGYAESTDGLNWTRKDGELDLDVSESGWDSDMMCYTAVLEIKGKSYMFYNGNNFGETGFGLAVLDQ